MRDRFSFGLKMRILVFSENLFHPPANFKNPKFCRGYRVSYRLKLPRSPATTFVWTLEVCIWELAWVSEIWWALLIYRGSGNLAKIYGKAVWASEYFCIYKKNMSWWHEKMFVTNPLGIMKTLRKQNQFQRVIPTTLPTYLEKKTVFKEETLTTSNQEFENVPIITERVARPDGT